MKHTGRQSEIKFNGKRLTGRIVLILFFVAAGVGAFMYRDKIMGSVTKVFAATDEDPIPLQVLESGPYQLEVPAFGEITGFGTTPVSTPNVRSGGLTIAWLIDQGSFVSAGDPVVRFDSTQARLNLETQQNLLQSNEEQTKITTTQQETDSTVLGLDRRDAQEDYDYAMSVMPEDETIFSKWDIIEAQLDANYAKARIDVLANKARVQKRIDRADQQILAIQKNKAEAEMAIAQQTLNSLELRSPGAGLVLYRQDHRRDPQVGDESYQGQILIDLVDLSALQARVYVLERDAGTLSKGKEVELSLDAMPRQVFHGTIRAVSALAQPLERQSPLKYFACEVVINDAGEHLKKIKPGMSLEAKVVLEKYDNCFVVPASAVTTKGTENLVYVKQQDQFIPKKVELGMGLHGQATILKGVEANEVIALRNPFETRKAYLPDFSKGVAGQQRRGGGRRMMMGGRGH